MADVSVFQSLLTTMTALLNEMQQKLEQGQYVELGSSTLTALETITAVVNNWPSDYPDAAVLAKLETIRSLLAATLNVSVTNHPTDFPDSAVLAKLEAIRVILNSVQTVSVNNFPSDFPDSATLAKLEAIRLILAATQNVSVVNFPSDYPDTNTLAKLEAIRLQLAGDLKVDVQDWPSDFPDSATLAKLEAIRAAVTGTLSVDASVTNFPSDYPDATAISKLVDVVNAQQEMLDSLMVVLEGLRANLPRVDGSKRLMISHAESNPTVAIAASQTLATVTTVGNQTNIGGRDASNAAFALANAGAHTLYDNILVS